MLKPLHYLGALLAGALLPLAYAPFDFWPLALAAPLALLWLWDHAQRPAHAALLGGLFGLGWFGVGISWVYISLYQYGHAPLVFALLCNAIVILLMSLYPCVAGALTLRYTRPGPLRWLVWLPSLWLLLEWVRSWLFTGFPWLSFGYSQTDSWLAGYAPVLGVYGLGALLWLSAGLLRWALVARRRTAVALLSIALMWGTGAALQRYSWTHSVGAALPVALVQANIQQQDKFDPEQLERTLRLYAAMSFNQGRGAKVIIWPETAIAAFYDDVKPFVEALREEELNDGTDYLSGIAAGSWTTNIFYNSVISIGQSETFYHKRRLLPFGEYLPLRGLLLFFRDLVEIPMADFTPGAEQQPLPVVAGQPVGVSICFEAVFAHEIAKALPEARFLVNLSNDAWFDDSLAPYQHLQIARMRAIEAQRWLARATNTGISALISPQGHVVAQTQINSSEVLRGELQPLQGLTLYMRWGDTPWLLLAALLCGLAYWQSRKAANHPAPTETPSSGGEL